MAKMAKDLTGNCYLCGVNLNKVAMKNHILKVHGEDKGGKDCCLLKIEGVYDKSYWLYVDIPLNKSLEDLDDFLRRIWLECCGHMSMFCRPRYDEIDMSSKLKSFPQGDKFFHHYDFGTTTETLITFMGNIIRKDMKDIVRLLARNSPPVFKCKNCGELAEYIYQEHDEEYKLPFYCEECVKSGEYDGMLLPITNSPRMGECGYGGELDIYTFDPASIKKST